METVAAFQSSFTNVSHLPPDWAARSGSNRMGFTRVGFKSQFSNASIQNGLSISNSNFGIRKLSFSRKRCAIRASMHSNSDGSAGPIAPLLLESPFGQFLSQILISHPHLVPAAVEQQLEQLQSDRDAEKEKEGSSASGTELVLYRRIAEVKSNERKKALEEILYALVVQKFMDANVPLVPAIAPSPPSPLTSQEEKVQHLHSPEAYEMIQNHLALILGNQLGDSNSMAQISKLRVGQIYAASVMYGYFLKRIDQRFQLEKTMKILPQGEGTNIQQVIADETRPGNESSEKPFGNAQPHPEVSSWAGGIGAGNFTSTKPSRLRTYVMSFDGETLHRYATIRSKEAIGIIEKHTEALFGRPEIVISPQGTIDSSKDEQIKISFGGLKRLILEAVTFGSFLWDAESYVDMSCVENPQQNRKVERKQQHLLQVARSLLFHAHLPLMFWSDCMQAATHIINRVPSKILGNKSPFEILHHKPPTYLHLKIFGCLCYDSTLSTNRTKFDARAIKCVFIGYPLRIQMIQTL